jgi:hypothetical protein
MNDFNGSNHRHYFIYTIMTTINDLIIFQIIPNKFFNLFLVSLGDNTEMNIHIRFVFLFVLRTNKNISVLYNIVLTRNQFTQPDFNRFVWSARPSRYHHIMAICRT